MVLFCSLWDTLKSIQSLEFTGPAGTGEGTVIVTNPSPNTLLFAEKGTWQTNTGVRLAFFNTYRWTTVNNGQTIRLEHLRHGANHPVFLFGLAPISENLWESVTGHP
jgi:hypothetical protein